MEIETFYPANPLLKNYIEYYYFLKSNSADYRASYYVFPTTLQAFNIHRHAECRIGPDSILVQGDKSYPARMIAQGRFGTPLFVDLEGIFDKVTIVFKPLGINHFIEGTFNDNFPHHSQLFTGWNNDHSFKYFQNEFFQTEENAVRVSVLEDYLLSRYRPLQEDQILRKVIERLTDFEDECSIDYIVKSLGMNTRTFNRLFHKNLGISPIAYRKVARFRHSLRNKLFNKKFEKLTSIGYESNYSDQSYFIKMYKKITGSTPANFFGSVDKLANDQLIFKFISRQT